MLHNLFLLDISMYIFNDLVIKNDLVKKLKSFVFMGVVQQRQRQVLVVEDGTSLQCSQ